MTPKHTQSFKQDTIQSFVLALSVSDVESSRTSLASRTHFEVLGLEGQVLGLGLEVSSPRKLACSRLEDSTTFWIVKILWRSPEKFLWRPFSFWRALALVSLVLGLGLEHSCPWPRECLSSERLSLALASDFFCVFGLGLKPCVLDSTSGSIWSKLGILVQVCKLIIYFNIYLFICVRLNKGP